MKRTLVGVDRSGNAACALRWAAGITASLGTELVAVMAWTPNQAELPPEEWERDHREVRQLLDEYLSEVPDTAGSTRAEVVDGEPVQLLLERADSEDAALIVVGMRGEGGFPMLRVGSVADTLAHHTSRPLAVIPDGARPKVSRIVLGVDGSDGAQTAAAWCASFARDLHAEVVAVCADSPLIGRLHEHDAADIREQIANDLHTSWTAPLRKAGVPVREELVSEPHVADALLTAAEATDADVIVVGTHGLAPLIRMRIGGVAMSLLHATTLPLILVPPQ
jgi:nucleotide-binding universal stress UspA family protein